MKTFAAAGLVGLGLILATSAAQEPAKDAPKDAPKAAATAPGDLKDLKQKASYSIGLNAGKNIVGMAGELDLDTAIVMRGIRDAIAGGKPALTEAEVEETMRELQKKVYAMREAKAAQGKKVGQDFLAANKGKEGVKVTKSGLQFKVLKEGTGRQPKATDTVKVHYRGTLTDGTEFDSSYKRNEPTSFPVNRVIPGWVEGLQLMKEGSKYQFFIPSDLAYGAEPPPGSSIPPDSVLLFEVELLKVQ